MVETTGFENRHTARYREFESPPLRLIGQRAEGDLYKEGKNIFPKEDVDIADGCFAYENTE